MAKKFLSSKTTDGIMVFSNSFTDARLSFNSIGGYNADNASSIMSKLGASKESQLNLNVIKTRLFKENSIIKNSYANINASPTKNIEYYPHYAYRPGMFGNTDSSFSISDGYENIFMPSPDVLFGMNNYRFKYSSIMTNILDLAAAEDPNKPAIPIVTKTPVGPAMFNPLYMISVQGLTNNTPLINNPNVLPGGGHGNISDCSIKELVRQSQNDSSILGLAKYKYSDFMYCKDLGKVSNNHLITLRVFPFPVGDHIQEYAGKEYDAPHFTFSSAGDVGRLVTWFGTDDNKLEDILHYEYHATWKELNAEIEQVDSKENDQSRGPLGMLINTFSPQYNKSVEQGFSSNQSLWGKIGGSTPEFDSTNAYTDYDKNKVYEPKDTVQATHVYEGKLEFTHEFTLNFSYKLRAYDNINPRSAFLDLIGNILAVTYRRGHFWGGDRKFFGPPQNTSAWQHVNNIIDKKFDQVGGIYKGLLDNGINFQDFLGCLSGLTGMAESLFSKLKDKINEAGGFGQMMNNLLTELDSKTNFSAALKGKLKNAIGRPALYAMNSLLKGDDVGLWHVTIGNPKNPIVSMGNLIITNASITHSGPLGIDDFPTEIKVSVTLKHARGRDAVEISKMYANGIRALYSIPKEKDITKFYGHAAGAMMTVDKNGNPTNTKKLNNENSTDTSKTLEEKARENEVKNKVKFNISDLSQDEDINRINSKAIDRSEIKHDVGQNNGYVQGNEYHYNGEISNSGHSLVGEESYGQLSDTMVHRVINEIR